jgi:hypothetical protein
MSMRPFSGKKVEEVSLTTENVLDDLDDIPPRVIDHDIPPRVIERLLKPRDDWENQEAFDYMWTKHV